MCQVNRKKILLAEKERDLKQCGSFWARKNEYIDTILLPMDVVKNGGVCRDGVWSNSSVQENCFWVSVTFTTKRKEER